MLPGNAVKLRRTGETRPPDSLEATDPQKARKLTRHNVERGSRHKATDRRRGYELDEPAQMEQANSEDNEPANECDGGGDLRTGPFIGMGLIDVLDDLGDGEGHDSHGADGHVFRSREEL